MASSWRPCEQTAADDVVSVAQCGEQVTASDPGSWYLRESPRELVGYVFTDKPIYRPGHTVHLKALLRWRARGALLPFDATDVEVRISDVTNKVIYRQRKKVDAFGGISADVPLGAGVALGDYSIAVLHGEDTASGGFEVQEYRKPEFEVRVTSAERFVVQGGRISATVNARYYFGQPVANARLAYVVHKQPYYSPLRWSDEDEDGGGYWYGDDQILEGQGRLNANGTVTIDVPAVVDDNGRDYSLRIEARVTDASNREVAGTTLAHATYGAFLVAASIDTYVARPGGTVTLAVRAVSYTGVPQAATPIRVAVLARTANARWDDEGGTREVTTATVTTDAEGRAAWTVPVPQTPGDYRVRASAQSGARTVADDSYLWVPGAQQRTDEDYGSDKYLELIAEKKTVQPGETSRFLIRGAEFDAQVLVTKEADGVSWHQVVRARGNETIEVPITADDIGDTWVNIVFLKDDRLYRAERRVKVPAVSRQLAVTITADSSVSKPRTPGRFAIKAVDATGAPVRAQFALGVIDEAVYGVKADATADPLRFFYQRNYSRVGTTFSREYSIRRILRQPAVDAGPAQAAVRTGRLQGRQARAAAGPQGIPRCHLLGGRRGHRCAGRGLRAGDLPRRAHDLAPHRAWRDRRHARRPGRGAHDRHQGSDRAGDHAALPHRGRRRRDSGHRAQLPAGRTGDRPHVDGHRD